MQSKKALSVRIPAELKDDMDKLGNNTTDVAVRLLQQGLAWRERFGDTLPAEGLEPSGLAKEIAELRELLASLSDRVAAVEKPQPAPV